MFVKAGRVLLVALLAVLAVLAFSGTAHAQDQNDDPGQDVTDSLDQFAEALGLGAAVSVFVQVLKSFNLVPDGRGGQVATGLNLVLFIVLSVAGQFGYSYQQADVQEALTVVGQLVATVMSSILFFRGASSASLPGYRTRKSEG